MKLRRALLIVGAAAVVGLTIWTQLRMAALTPLSPIPAADNPGPMGLEAAYRYLEAQGRAGRIDGPDWTIPADARVVLTALPYAREVEPAAREALAGWIDRGGTLVVLGAHQRGLGGLAARALDPLPVALSLRDHQVGLADLGADVASLLRAGAEGDHAEAVAARAALPDPLTAGVRRIEVSTGRGFSPDLGPALPLFVVGDTPVALTLRRGRGRIVAFAGADALTNARIDQGANLQLLANLGAVGKVYFDELHHQPSASVAAAQLSRWLGPGLLQLMLLGGVLVLASGRRLGPIRPPPPPAGRTARAYAVQLGRLYRRAGAEGSLCAELRAELQVRVERRLGLPPGVDEAERVAGLSARSPALAARYRALLEQLDAATRRAPGAEGYAALAREAVALGDDVGALSR